MRGSEACISLAFFGRCLNRIFVYFDMSLRRIYFAKNLVFCFVCIAFGVVFFPGEQNSGWASYVVDFFLWTLVCNELIGPGERRI